LATAELTHEERMSQLDATIAALNEQLVAAPHDVTILEQLAEASANRFSYGEAVSCATKVILLGHDSAKIRAIRGRCHGYGNNAPAIEDFEVACAFEPLNTEHLLNLAMYHGWEEDFDAVIAATSKALMLEPDNWWGLEQRSAAYRKQGKFAPALRDAQKHISVSDNKSLPYVQLAHIFVDMENLADAKNALAMALHYESNCPPALEMLLGIALEEKDYAQAIQRATALLADRPDLSDYYYLRGVAYAALKQQTEARADWEKCLTLEPDHGDAKQALEAMTFDDILETELDAIAPAAVALLQQAQDVYENAGDKQAELMRAVAILDRAIKTAGGAFPRAHTIKAQVFHDLHELAKCLAETTLALQESPNEFGAQYIIAILNVVNCPTEPEPPKNGIVGDMARSSGGGFFSQLFSAGSDEYQRQKAITKWRQEQAKMLGEVDKLLEIYARLTDHGVYDYNYLTFSENLLYLAEEIRNRDLPYQKNKLAAAILDVPAEKIFTRSDEAREFIEQVRQTAQGEMQR
jgi:tetratricopeptide (TPR) repeat protein